MGVEHAGPRRIVRRGMSLGGLLGVALLLTACGEGPTEPNEPRLCRIQLGELAPVAPTPGVPVLPIPVPVPRVWPVQDLNCRSDLAPRDSSITPLPRPVPIPVPGGD